MNKSNPISLFKIVSYILFALSLTTTLADNTSIIETERSDKTISHNVYNGRLWNKLDKQTKIFYLNALEESFSMITLQIIENKEKPEVLTSHDKVVEILTVQGFRFSDLVQQVDMVYKDTSNLRVPIIEAYRYILRKLKGASPEILGKEIASLRKRYNK